MQQLIKENMESRNVMKKYIGILAKITGFILIVILAVNIILPLIKEIRMQLMRKNWNRLHLRKKR